MASSKSTMPIVKAQISGLSSSNVSLFGLRDAEVSADPDGPVLPGPLQNRHDDKTRGILPSK